MYSGVVRLAHHPSRLEKRPMDDRWMDDRWMSVEEIAAHLGVSKDTLYTWVSSKRMPGHRVGRFWKFKKDEVDDWVRSGGASTVTPHQGEGER